MSYKIFGDSCLDLTEELKKDPRFEMIPLTLQVDDHMIMDDETFDQKAFLAMVKASPNCPKTACPSPEAFKKACECDADDIYIITLSSHLSGTYNSAVLGKELYEEEHGKGKKNILVIDSESASAGELNEALAIRDMYEEGLTFSEISERILKMRDEQQTYFVIDTLEPLRKNGRLTGLQAFFATALNIKPVMGADHGVIIKLDQARGMNKALVKMAQNIVDKTKDSENKILAISHCNCRERAVLLKNALEERMPVKHIVILDTAGVSSMYANDGGVIVAV
mgnify:CR=1 FL=1